jgi:hypothetical protein
MTDCAEECCSVIDAHGLHALANLSGNLKAVALAQLESGALGVMSAAWQEFEDLYEEEAQMLAPHIARKINVVRKYNVGAASIADRLNSRFSDGAYGRNADLFTGSAALVEGYTVVTVAGRTQVYERMECEVADLATWAAAL